MSLFSQKALSIPLKIISGSLLNGTRRFICLLTVRFPRCCVLWVKAPRIRTHTVSPASRLRAHTHTHTLRHTNMIPISLNDYISLHSQLSCSPIVWCFTAAIPLHKYIQTYTTQDIRQCHFTTTFPLPARDGERDREREREQ